MWSVNGMKRDPRAQLAMAQHKEGAEGRRRAQEDERFQGYLGEGRDALTESMRATAEGAMPAFRQELQGLRESARRRGISNGETAGYYENDLAGRFDRNLQQAMASQSVGMYGMARDLQAADRDREMMERNAKRQSRANLWGGLGRLAGAGIGFAMGGPAGAAAGAGLTRGY